MTYRPSTDPDPSTWEEALAYLREAGLDPAGTMPLADALYELVGPDPKRLGAALALLKLVEAALAEGLDMTVLPKWNHAPAKVELGHDDFAEFPDGGLGDACRRLLARLKDGGP